MTQRGLEVVVKTSPRSRGKKLRASTSAKSAIPGLRAKTKAQLKRIESARAGMVLRSQRILMG